MQKLHVYRAADGWRWRLKARNGRIIADSGEAYKNRSRCVQSFVRVKTAGWELIYDEPPTSTDG